MDTHKQWHKLPAGHPIRILGEMRQAHKALTIARGRAKDDGMFAMRETEYRLAQAELKRCQKRYDKKRAAWEAAGCPDANGKRTKKGAGRGV